MTDEVQEVLSELLSISRSEQISLYNYKDFKVEGTTGITDLPNLIQQINFKEFWIALKSMKSVNEDINMIDFGFSDYTHFIKIINDEYLIHMVATTNYLNPGKVMAVLGLARMKLQDIL